MRLVVLIICLIFWSSKGSAQARSDFEIQDSLQQITRNIYDFKNAGNLEGAIQEIDRGLKIAGSADRINSIVDFYNLYARLQMEFNTKVNPNLFLKEAKEVLAIYEYPEGKAETLILQAYVSAKSSNREQAELLIKESREVANFNDKSLLNLLLYYEGLTYKELGDFSQAKASFRSIIPPTHKYEKEYLLAKSQFHLAEIYLAEGNLESARILLNSVSDYTRQYNFPKVLHNIYKLRYQLAEKSGDYKEAFIFHKASDSLEDLYFSPDIIRSQNEAAYSAETQFLNNVIERMSQNEIETQQQVNISKLTSVLSSALLIIISLLTISLYRNNQIKFKTNDLLLKKNNELQKAKEEAERAMQAKSQFLSTVSHELRTPLYAVTGLTHLLLEEDPKDSQKEHLESLKYSGEYLLDFINDILQINKIDANKLTLDEIEFDLRDTLREVGSSLQQSAQKNNNKLVIDVHQDVPGKLLGDPLKLSQIFINLVGNALKFTENGEVRVIARPVDVETETCAIHFEVNDNGIGISRDMQENIFDSFSQGSVQINRKYGGTGLGLTIVKSLLGLFKSSIELESELGSGSSFKFDIAFKIPETKVVEVKTPDADLEENTNELFASLNILVVEDNKINQVITQKMLHKKNITCEIANNGYEAVEKAQTGKFDLILMDIHMPGISGLKATEEIRKFDKQTPIIALTAISLDENMDDFYSAGCSDVITKPFKPEVFYEALAKNIRLSQVNS